MDEAMSHSVDFQNIVPELVHVLTEGGAFGWQLKYKVRYVEYEKWDCLYPTGLGKAAKECPCCEYQLPFHRMVYCLQSCEFCGTVNRLSVVSKYLRRAVVANGVAPPRWWREWAPEERLRMVAAGMELYGHRRVYNRLLATLDDSGYEPHSSESESDSEDKAGFWAWEPDPTDPDGECLVFNPIQR